MKVGILGNAVLDAAKLNAIADIPSREAVLSQLLGTILEPASRIARVIKNKFNPDEKTTPAEVTTQETI
jgi:ribosomal protein L10